MTSMEDWKTLARTTKEKADRRIRREAMLNGAIDHINGYDDGEWREPRYTNTNEPPEVEPGGELDHLSALEDTNIY
jgi:hypothetical protein